MSGPGVSLAAAGLVLVGGILAGAPLLAVPLALLVVLAARAAGGAAPAATRGIWALRALPLVAGLALQPLGAGLVERLGWFLLGLVPASALVELILQRAARTR